MPDSPFFDSLETQDPSQREERLFAALREQVAHAQDEAPFFAGTLAGIDAQSLTDRAALAKLPVVRKGELIELQKKRVAERDPFGGMTTVKTGNLGRIFMSPGPIYDPEAARADYWRIARALWAAGFRRGMVAHNSFSYHLTPAGSMLEMGAHAIGCAVVPAGVGNTELQVRALADVRPDGYIGTPSFLKILLDKAKEMDTDVSSVKRAMVSGEALPKALRAEMKDRGVDVLQCYATADLGLIGYESIADEGLILDEWVIVEIVRPGTGETLPDGQVGEVVVTTLNPDYPLIRFGTGDLSTFVPGASSCGRTGKRLKGWMGRADQTTKVKGMFVHPGQIAEVAKRHGIAKFRLVVTREGDNDVMTLKVEAKRDEALASKIGESLVAVTKLKGAVEFVDALPNDGKTIDDSRKYD